MTVRELLEREEFRFLKLINKEGNLNRMIITVESTETPDVASFLPRNTLLLTTAMAFQDDTEGLCSFIRSLNEIKCAGLAVKLGRFLHKIDQRVIDLADEMGFPLIQIPMESTLGAVYQKILSCIWNNENENLLNALNIQKKFSMLLLQGAPMKNMLNNLGMILEKPVAIVDLFGDIYEDGYKCSKRERELARTTCMRIQEEVGRLSDSVCYMDEVCISEQICVFPIKGIGRITHYLCVLRTDSIPGEMLALMIEEVLLIIGIYFYKKLYLIYNEVRMREEFLHILLNKFEKEVWTARQILIMGERYGFEASNDYSLILARISDMDGKIFQAGSFTPKEEQYLLIYSWLKGRIKKQYGKKVLFLPGSVDWEYIMVLQGECRNMKDMVNDIHREVKQKFNIHMKFSFSNNTERLEELRRLYQEAIEAFRGREESDEDTFIYTYRPKNIIELLKTVPGGQIRELCLYTLKELAYPADEMTEELKKTLRTYLDCRCSVSKTADLMFLHRNTIKYRIKRCEEILQGDFSNPDFCFQLQVGLLLSDY